MTEYTNNKASSIQNLIKTIILWCIGGISYLIIELLWRGYSHWTMFIVGGICFLEVGAVNEYFPETMYMEVQAIIGACLITMTEFLSGIVINLILGWNVWDYSGLPLNIMGQVCLLYTFLWWFVSMMAIYIDDKLRENIFLEKPVTYRFLFINKKR